MSVAGYYANTSSTLSNCRKLAVDHDAAANGDFHHYCGRKFPTFAGLMLSSVWAAIITSSGSQLK